MRRRWILGTLLAALSSCTGRAPAPVPDPTARPVAPAGHGGASPSPAPGITGGVRPLAALLGERGSGLVSDVGSAIVSNNGGSLIGNNGAGLVSDVGSAVTLGDPRLPSVASNNGGGLVGLPRVPYHLAAATPRPTGGGPLAGLVGVFMVLTDRAGKTYLDPFGRAYTCTTDAHGRYAFAPDCATQLAGKDVIVNARANGNMRMLGYMVPAAGANALDLTLGTTLATELVRGDALATGKALKRYGGQGVARAAAATDDAIAAGDIAALAPAADPNAPKVGVFDLRADQSQHLRDQYAIALGAVDAGNLAVKALSDTWRSVLGHRPAAVTTLLDHVGYSYGVAVARRGDVFSAHYTPEPDSGFISWIKPDGQRMNVALSRPLGQILDVTVEKEPTDDPRAPGTLLVADDAIQVIWRVPILEHADPAWPVTIVAGEGDVVLDEDRAAHPATVDGAAAHPALDVGTAVTSAFRAADEGERRYADGRPVPRPARFAYLASPEGVVVDEAGNIYIADSGNHRVRFIPKADGQYFGYRTPRFGADGAVTGLGEVATLKAGCLYTIAGSPGWDPAIATDYGGGSWLAAFDGDGGPAQQAKLGYPQTMAFHDGYLYVNDNLNQRIRRIARATGVIETVVGSPAGPADPATQAFPDGTAGDGGPAVAAQLATPAGIAIDPAGRLYIADDHSGRLRMVDVDGTIRTLAGRLHVPGEPGTDRSGDGEALYGVDLYDTWGLAVDATGSLVFADNRHLRVRKLWRPWSQEGGS